MLDSFKELKMTWDHAFFKSVVLSQIDDVVEPEGDFTTITDDVIDHGEEMVAKGLDSIIDSRYLSYLS